MMTVDHTHVTDVEHDIIVRFDSVVTLPVHLNGKIVVVYVGITGLQKLAIGEGTAGIRPATDADVIEVARRLELYQQALPALEGPQS